MEGGPAMLVILALPAKVSDMSVRPSDSSTYQLTQQLTSYMSEPGQEQQKNCAAEPSPNLASHGIRG